PLQLSSLVPPVEEGMRGHCSGRPNQHALLVRLGRASKDIPDDPLSHGICCHKLWIMPCPFQAIEFTFEQPFAVLEATNAVRLPFVQALSNHFHQVVFARISES